MPEVERCDDVIVKDDDGIVEDGVGNFIVLLSLTSY